MSSPQKRKLDLSGDVVSFAQQHLSYDKDGPYAWKKMDENSGGNSILVCVDFKRHFSDPKGGDGTWKEWDVPDNIDVLVKEMNDLRTVSNILVECKFMHSKNIPRLFIFVDYPKDFLVVQQTLLKYVQCKDFRDGDNNFRNWLAGKNTLAVQDVGGDDCNDLLVLNVPTTLRKWLTSTEKGMGGRAADKNVEIECNTPADRAITLDNLKELAKFYRLGFQMVPATA